jgi:hypothetical protein
MCRIAIIFTIKRRSPLLADIIMFPEHSIVNQSFNW